jgi:hypothetical protein
LGGSVNKYEKKALKKLNALAKKLGLESDEPMEEAIGDGPE